MPVTLYCTDEDVLIRAPIDYQSIAPNQNDLATSASAAIGSESWVVDLGVSLESRGVEAGAIAILRQPGRSSRFGPEGDSFVVSAVSGTTATLRRPGFSDSIGDPPGGPDGVDTVNVRITTLEPQIESASYRINNRYGIDAALADRGPDDLYDIREIQELCVLMVLKRLYFDAWNHGKDNLWLMKLKDIDQEINELIPSIRLHWGPDGTSDLTSSFNTRLSR